MLLVMQSHGTFLNNQNENDNQNDDDGRNENVWNLTWTKIEKTWPNLKKDLLESSHNHNNNNVENNGILSTDNNAK
jgi:hypothetical protein